MNDPLTRARLEVVQPSTRRGFQRRAMDVLRELVPAPASFFCFGTDDTRAYGEAMRFAKGAMISIATEEPIRLSTAFGFELRSVASSQRRVYSTLELYDNSDKVHIPYFRDHALADGLTEAVLIFLHEGGVLFGVCGLERSAGAFTPEECATLEAIAPFLVAGARAQMAYDDLSREASCLRAFARHHGSYYVVNRDTRRVIWAANRDHGIDWTDDVTAHETEIVHATEKAMRAKGHSEALPTPPRIGASVVLGAAKLENEPVFGNARCAVLRTEVPEEQRATLMQTLSKREREIARLLVAGYSGVNVAAIAGLSENTVRTYVRRLYAKLGVSNRADLVRKLMTPEPASRAPASTLAPPPDSSLAYGDDTLD